MVTLRNRTKQPRVYNLTHEHYCVRDGTCSCSTTTTIHSATAPGGAHGTKTVRRRVPAVLTILAGQTVDVRSAALHVPEIARDVAARILVASPEWKTTAEEAREAADAAKPEATVRTTRRGRAR
jgi:hypothetical protein